MTAQLELANKDKKEEELNPLDFRYNPKPRAYDLDSFDMTFYHIERIKDFYGDEYVNDFTNFMLFNVISLKHNEHKFSLNANISLYEWITDPTMPKNEVTGPLAKKHSYQNINDLVTLLYDMAESKAMKNRLYEYLELVRLQMREKDK